MRRHISKRGSAVVTPFLAIGLFAVATSVCSAANGGNMPSQTPPGAEIRSGGVIEQSYAYHRQPPGRVTGAARSVEPASGWYGYGFPVSTFRWGWFGAAHYYPTVFWHHGYYGDCCRYGYRRGY